MKLTIKVKELEKNNGITNLQIPFLHLHVDGFWNVYIAPSALHDNDVIKLCKNDDVYEIFTQKEFDKIFSCNEKKKKFQDFLQNNRQKIKNGKKIIYPIHNRKDGDSYISLDFIFEHKLNQYLVKTKEIVEVTCDQFLNISRLELRNINIFEELNPELKIFHKHSHYINNGEYEIFSATQIETKEDGKEYEVTSTYFPKNNIESLFAKMGKGILQKCTHYCIQEEKPKESVNLYGPSHNIYIYPIKYSQKTDCIVTHPEYKKSVSIDTNQESYHNIQKIFLSRNVNSHMNNITNFPSSILENINLTDNIIDNGSQNSIVKLQRFN